MGHRRRAAQILFTLFGEIVFKRGAAGIGEIWGAAGVGLVAGGLLAHRLGNRLNFRTYKWAISICYVINGVSYVVFRQMRNYPAALAFIALSRGAMAVSSVLNYSVLLRSVDDAYRGRVFSTGDTLVWATMMLSLMGAAVASQSFGPRDIGAVAGVLSSLTAIF